jgi:para-nitrobenzyl esterase
LNGFFKRVIAQSGALTNYTGNPELSNKILESLIDELKLKERKPEVILDKLQKLPIDEILDLQAKIGSPSPVIDSDIIPSSPLELIQNGSAKSRDLLIGSDWNESSLFNFGINQKYAETLTDESALQLVSNRLNWVDDKNKIDRLFKTYKKNRKNLRDLVDGFVTDLMFRIPSIVTAEAHLNENKNTYMYLFNYPSPFKNEEMGAIHTIENVFVFGSLGEYPLEIYPPKNKETIILSEKIMDSWINFAYTGNPNHPNIPKWPNYDLKNRSTMIFNKEMEIIDDPSQSERKIWNNL